LLESLVIKDENDQPAPVYSCASGLDYPSVGPEHAYLYEQKRFENHTVNDIECIEAFFILSRLEGIIPALESAHAVAYAIKLAKECKSESILVNLSGRGDKDIDYVMDTWGEYCDKFPNYTLLEGIDTSGINII
jgi:tryptophan synthase beta subunit